MYCKRVAGAALWMPTRVSQLQRWKGMFKQKKEITSPRRHFSLLAIALFVVPCGWASEGPFFITYTHQMEEPGNLEFALKSVTGSPANGRRFLGSSAEFEYGVKGWWTTELYLDEQTTRGDGSGFAGYRWENRF